LNDFTPVKSPLLLKNSLFFPGRSRFRRSGPVLRSFRFPFSGRCSPFGGLRALLFLLFFAVYCSTPSGRCSSLFFPHGPLQSMLNSPTGGISFFLSRLPLFLLRKISKISVFLDPLFSLIITTPLSTSFSTSLKLSGFFFGLIL